jgi:signal transduction histidine kinase
LTNLVANALRQVKDDEELGGTAGAVEDRPRREVRLRVSEGDAGIVVDVEDDGPGVPPDKRAAIFERFASFDAAGSLASGIGLPVARELAELNGGSLVLVEETRCTTFRLILPNASGPLVSLERRPARQDVGRAPGERPHDVSEPRPAVPAEGPATLPSVLVVEDHPDMRRLLERLLGDRFRVLVAPDCAAARRALALETPAAVVCDVMLPDGDGYDVLDHVRRGRAFDGVPLLFLSALADDEQRVRGLAAGADDYLTKPFSGVELVTRVEVACKRAAERRQALEAQRLDFAAELHDGVSASLSRAAILLSAPARSERVEAAHAAVRDALDEVRTLLSLSDGDAEPWAELVREVETELGTLAAPFGLPLEFASGCDGTLRTVSPVLRHTLRRIAVEALTNAIKHAGPKHLSCRVEVLRGRVRLRVEDDGVGIRGVEEKADVARSVTGGRGLAIARRRVERLGGTLAVRRRAGRGTCVEASVPVMELPGSPEGPSRTETARAAAPEGASASASPLLGSSLHDA